MLLASQDAEGATGGMTAQQVRDECLTLLLAGHETTANGLSFIFFLMAQHPDVQEKVFAEASSVFGTGALRFASDRCGNLRTSALLPASGIRSSANVSAGVGHGALCGCVVCLSRPGDSRRLPAAGSANRNSPRRLAGIRNRCISIPTAFFQRRLPPASTRVSSPSARVRASVLEKTSRGWRRFWFSPASSATGVSDSTVPFQPNFH